MSQLSIWEKGLKDKYRFPHPKAAGQLTMEDLYKLEEKDLDKLGQILRKELKDLGSDGESWISSGANPKTRELENKLEIVKAVFIYKRDLREKREQRSVVAEEEQVLLDLSIRKKAQALEQLTPEQIEEKLAAIRNKKAEEIDD